MEGHTSAVTILLTFLFLFHVCDRLVASPEISALHRSDSRTQESENESLSSAVDAVTSRRTILVDVSCGELRHTLGQLSGVIDTLTGIKIPGHPITFINDDRADVSSVISWDCEDGRTDTPPLLSEVVSAVEQGVSYTGPALYVVTDNLENGQELSTPDWARIVDSGVRVSFVLVNTSTSVAEGQHSVQRRAAPSTTTAPMLSSIYQQIAQWSGGQVILTNKQNIGKVVSIIRQTTKANTVDIMRFTDHGRMGSHFNIPIDATVDHFMVQLQTDFKPPAFVIVSMPTHFPAPFANGSDYTRDTLGDTLLVLEMNTTKLSDYGLWTFEKLDNVPWHVHVTAQSKVGFTHTFLEKGPRGSYPLKGRPIAGASHKLSVTVPQYSLVQRVTTALFLRPDNSAMNIVNLINVGGRRGKSLFYAQTIIPTKDFNVAIEGVDKSGNLFRRMDTVMISPISIRLSVPSMAGVALYKNETLAIPFTVTNAASRIQDVDVKIEDNRGFSQPPVALAYLLPAGANKSDTLLTIRAGNTVGETVTVTVTASPAARGHILPGQYEILHFTVEERHKKKPNDTIDPTCNVTTVVGKCQIGADLCKCDQHMWTMDVQVGDVGFGLRNIFTTGAGANSTFSHDNFTVGQTMKQRPVKASIAADCCHQNAAIQVEDKAGNVATCTPNITPNFKPPDPKLCNNTNPNITIPCQSINTTGTCNFGPNPCDCHSQGWHIRAEFHTVGWNLFTCFTRGAGVNSTITRNGSIVELDSDCCHQQITVVGIDIANNVGECRVSLSNFTAPSSTRGCTTTTSTSTTTTTAATSTPTTTPTTTTTTTKTTPTSTTTTTTPTSTTTTTTPTSTTTTRKMTTAATIIKPKKTKPTSPSKATTKQKKTPKTTTTTTRRTLNTASTTINIIVPPTTSPTTPIPTSTTPTTTPATSTIPPTPTTTTTPPPASITPPTPTTTPTPAPTPTTPTTTTKTTPTTTTATTPPATKTLSRAATTAGTNQSNGNELSRDVVAGIMAGAGLACVATLIVMGILFRKAKSKIKPSAS